MSSAKSPSNTLDAVRRLKREIDRLTEQQSEARRQAFYVGMTMEEAKECDERRDLILKYEREIETLEKSQRKSRSDGLTSTRRPRELFDHGPHCVAGQGIFSFCSKETQVISPLWNGIASLRGVRIGIKVVCCLAPELSRL
jgi:ribosomal protein S21